MVKIGIIGTTGYAGQELVRLLRQHPQVELYHLGSRSYINREFASIYHNFKGFCGKECEQKEVEALAEEVDLIFLALPHGLASKMLTKKILSKCKVIDLGADYRIKDQTVYESWYKTEHGNGELLSEAVYGLPEWNRKKIQRTNLVANPGCYTTCSILALAPLLREGLIDEKQIVIDAKSGVSGAGRSLNIATHYNECNESVKAYKIATHRHTPEIEEELSILSNKKVSLVFTPHLIPMNRGILATCYGSLIKKVSYQEVKLIYEKYYQDEYFIRLLDKDVFPETRWVKGSNFCDINFQIDERNKKIIVIGAVDNLIKGAAGQAVQNMNILFDWPEKTGLEYIPPFPI